MFQTNEQYGVFPRIVFVYITQIYILKVNIKIPKEEWNLLVFE